MPGFSRGPQTAPQRLLRGSKQGRLPRRLSTRYPRPMANQLVLSWEVDTTNSSFGGAQAATALGAVKLYDNPNTDPVLGQLFGLTVAADNSVALGPTTARRALTLNMGPPHIAPPLFPCHPITSTPPTLPYPLHTTVELSGSFFVSNGSMSVATTRTQVPSLSVGDAIQFLEQQGVFYEVSSVSGTTVGITAPYTGTTSNSEALKEIAAPATLAAIYSTSPLDTAGVATVPAIQAGSGARTVILSYNDSTGAGPFTVTVSLTGKRPAAVALAGGSVDIAEIIDMVVATAGGFGNSVGQITLTELSSALPDIPANATPGTGIGAGQGDRTFYALTDQAQMLIGRALAYMPPSYAALSQQGESAAQLDGDFIVTTGSKDVPTTADQTGSLSTGNILQFASQLGTFYTVANVTNKIVTLDTPYSGIDDNGTGSNNASSNVGTKGNLGTSVIKKSTGAMSPVTVSAPTNNQLSTLLGQFVATETAQPPPKPPLSPSTVSVPTFLSGYFTRTLQLALAVPVTPHAIAFI